MAMCLKLGPLIGCSRDRWCSGGYTHIYAVYLKNNGKVYAQIRQNQTNTNRNYHVFWLLVYRESQR